MTSAERRDAIRDLRKRLDDLFNEQDALREYLNELEGECDHEMVDRDGEAFCTVCELRWGRYCNHSPGRVCRNVTNNRADDCDFCGRRLPEY